MVSSKKSRKATSIVAMDGGAAGGPLVIKHLASCNKTTRDKAVKLLKTWLPNQPQVSAEDMKLIWKGLFYCVWHADKLPVQTELVDRLSSLLLTLDLPLSAHYFTVFLLTMRREWSGIDILRLDKFYLLIRKFMFSFFRLLKKNSWDLELSNRLVGVLDEITFSADDKYQGNGVNYHIASVFLDEIRRFLPIRLETLDLFFNLFISVMGKSPDKVLLGKIKSNIFDVLLKMGNDLLEVKKSGGEIDAGDEVVLFGTIALVLGFSNKFYELGSSPDCLQGNRKVLLRLHQDFLKLEKDLASSGIKVSIPEIKADDDEDEVPSLIPISTSTEEELGAALVIVTEPPLDVVKEVEADGSAIRRSKKREKARAVKEIDATSHSKKKEKPKKSSVSNLQTQFEKIAAEAGLQNDGRSVCELPKITVSKKRKRAKSMDGKEARKVKENAGTDGTAAKSGEMSAKKVRFSMKNNLVWKPQTPLPPQSVRIPPSVTPRGSGLKQGIPPGPVREILSPAAKKVKRVDSVKKVARRKGIKSVSPATKRLKKIRFVSMYS